ncbi:hypothetical protein ABFS83_11G044900 [Erythranthe nasuta]|uniref:zinc finger Ran-binding domain-containing protein 2 n=1 Tax=Erythranthe guttata TaxID=4155 RepID=UPI00064DA92A|nr:PREDICTED: zinc finger Ran-binding domain-containing protein 2 [Erythranthe guttata]|eukprot:XP_012854537.1 PREDICTED: zinc finger Ran-binding domain-containing protein 2 [Erythranthe guttata]
MSRVEGGDWMCNACQHINFKKRDSCQRCSCPKFATAAQISSYSIQLKSSNNITDQMMAGDWYCGSTNCGTHNYASRGACYRCGALKDYCGYGAGVIASAGYAYDVIPGWKTGDWICSRLGCGLHNYASRVECYKCRMPRDCGGQM